MTSKNFVNFISYEEHQKVGLPPAWGFLSSITWHNGERCMTSRHPFLAAAAARWHVIWYKVEDYHHQMMYLVFPLLCNPQDGIFHVDPGLHNLGQTWRIPSSSNLMSFQFLRGVLSPHKNKFGFIFYTNQLKAWLWYVSTFHRPYHYSAEMHMLHCSSLLFVCLVFSCFVCVGNFIVSWYRRNTVAHDLGDHLRIFVTQMIT